MSETIGGGYRGGTKQVCRECNRTVYIVEVDGKRVATDPDLISVVPLGQTMRLQARRVHAEMCLRYKSEAEKLKAQALAKRAAQAGDKSLATMGAAKRNKPT